MSDLIQAILTLRPDLAIRYSTAELAEFTARFLHRLEICAKLEQTEEGTRGD